MPTGMTHFPHCASPPRLGAERRRLPSLVLLDCADHSAARRQRRRLSRLSSSPQYGCAQASIGPTTHSVRALADQSRRAPPARQPSSTGSRSLRHSKPVASGGPAPNSDRNTSNAESRPSMRRTSPLMLESRTPTTDRPEADRRRRPAGFEQQPRFSVGRSSAADLFSRRAPNHPRTHERNPSNRRSIST